MKILKLENGLNSGKLPFVVLFGLSPGFYIFETYAGDGTPSISWMVDNWNWWEIPKQF